MIMTHVVRYLVELLAQGNIFPDTPMRYLDACAAPGGKTTAALQALPADAFVVANEYDFRRAEILKENIIKWGNGNVAVSRGDTAQFRNLPSYFHIIAADVPCSGEGMMRKDPKACQQWSRSLVRECASRQRVIVTNLWPALAPGGFMIYSTCTFNRDENEDTIIYMMEEHGAEIVAPANLADPSWGIPATDSMLRFIPGKIKGEGLALGVLRKPFDHEEPATLHYDKKDKKREKKTDRKNTPKNIPSDLHTLLDGDYSFTINEEGVISALPQHNVANFNTVTRHLDLIYKGVEVGTMKGKSFIPSHPLAMCTSLHGNAFPTVEADLPTALSYLRREALGGFEAPKGFLLLTHLGHPLGFVNNLGNRANNLYPQTWRIRKATAE